MAMRYTTFAILGKFSGRVGCFSVVGVSLRPVTVFRTKLLTPSVTMRSAYDGMAVGPGCTPRTRGGRYGGGCVVVSTVDHALWPTCSPVQKTIASGSMAVEASVERRPQRMRSHDWLDETGSPRRRRQGR